MRKNLRVGLEVVSRYQCSETGSVLPLCTFPFLINFVVTQDSFCSRELQQQETAQTSSQRRESSICQWTESNFNDVTHLSLQLFFLKLWQIKWASSGFKWRGWNISSENNSKYVFFFFKECKNVSDYLNYNYHKTNSNGKQQGFIQLLALGIKRYENRNELPDFWR